MGQPKYKLLSEAEEKAIFQTEHKNHRVVADNAASLRCVTCSRVLWVTDRSAHRLLRDHFGG